MKSRQRKSAPRPLSDLELVVLGIVWKRGPCTPYVIRMEFATSPSSHWRGSTGAIYPLVRRLAGERYLRVERVTRGRRRAVHCIVTGRGVAEIRRWLLPPLPPEAAAITYDPLRTRTPYLGLLTPSERRAALDEAIQRLRDEIPTLKRRLAWYEDLGDEFAALSVKGAMKVLAARLEWLSEMRRDRAMLRPRARQVANVRPDVGDPQR